MKKTTKALVFLILTVVTIIFTTAIVCFAAGGETQIYFIPGSEWESDNARFAAYTWNDGGEYVWVELVDTNDDGIYEGSIPHGYANIVFARLDPKDAHLGWSTTWNQTVDLTLPNNGNNLFTITTPWGSNANGNKGEGSWSKYDLNTCAHDYGVDNICKNCGEEYFLIIAGNVAKIDGAYMDGDNSTLFVSKWDVADENNRMFFEEESGCYVKIYENVAAGEYHFKIAENKSWDVSYGKDGGNCYLNVEEDGSTVVITFKDGSITSASRVVNTSQEPSEPDLPDLSDDPEDNLNFFQRIWKAIVNFFARLFGGKNK